MGSHRKGLKCIQGKGIVTHLDERGVETFIHHAKLLRRYGAAVVVMAFDEQQGRADTRARKIEICRRAYKILTEEVGFPPKTSSSTRIFRRRHRY